MNTSAEYPNSQSRPRLRKWLKAIWRDVEWVTIFVIGLTAVVLGYIGFTQQLPPSQGYSFWDYIYMALQLFPMQMDANQPGLPPILHIARMLAWFVAGYTIIKLVFRAFHAQLQLISLRWTRHHVIICGLGRKGLLMAREFRKINKKVVIIDLNEENPNATVCRELGILVLHGDGRDDLMLRKAGLERARSLVAVSGDDSTNAEIVEQVRAIKRTHGCKDITCSIHIEDPLIWNLLREQELTQKDCEQHFQLEFFNVYDSGARLLVNEYLFPGLEDGHEPSSTPQVLVVRLGVLAERLILHAARAWAPHYDRTRTKMPIRVIDTDPTAGTQLQDLIKDYPIISAVCDIRPSKLDLLSKDFSSPGFFARPGKESGFSHIFVCMEDTTSNLSAALSLLWQARTRKVEILVRMSEDRGLANLLKSSEQADAEYANLHAFGLLDRTCKPGLLDNGTHQLLARAIHKDYVRQQLAAGSTLADNPILAPWSELSSEYQASNLHQAQDIGRKLKRIGCTILPWHDYGAEKIKFDDFEVEIMAKMEHQRWCQEKFQDGWKYGPVRNNAKKIHPNLLDWDHPRLTEEAKKKDRDTVKRIPYFLSIAGFQMHRI